MSDSSTPTPAPMATTPIAPESTTPALEPNGVAHMDESNDESRVAVDSQTTVATTAPEAAVESVTVVPEDEDEDEDNDEETVKKARSLSSTFEAMSSGETVTRPSRARRAVERINVQTEESEIEIPTGRGVPLGSLPRVEAQLQEFTGGQPALKRLHSLCFGRPGKRHQVKARLLLFSGFEYDPKTEEGAQQRATLIARLDKDHMPLLKQLLTALNLPLAGKKSELIERLIDFLECPTGSTAPIPKKAKKAKKVTKRKRSTSTKKTAASVKSPATSRKKAATPTRKQTQKKTPVRASAPSKKKSKKSEIPESESDSDSESESESESATSSSIAGEAAAHDPILLAVIGQFIKEHGSGATLRDVYELVDKTLKGNYSKTQIRETTTYLLQQQQ